jgi:hypothetical protein
MGEFVGEAVRVDFWPLRSGLLIEGKMRARWRPGIEFQVCNLPFSASFEIEAKRKLPERESAWSRMQMQHRA